MTRVVVDPGALIAALISRHGSPARLLACWADGLFDLIVSPALLSELEGTLGRPKFRRYVTEEDTREYVDSLRRRAMLVDDPPEVERGLTPDPGDDYLVALAREAEAHLIVSGDHLPTLEGARPPVLTPAELLRLLES